MWTVIILIIAGVLIKFFYDINKQKEHVSRQGGMAHKYRTFIDYIKSGDPRTQVFNERGDSITLGIANAGGKTIFILTQTFGTVTVQWKVDSPLYGQHELEWTFDEFMDQHKMIEKVNKDLTVYQTNAMTSQL